MKKLLLFVLVLCLASLGFAGTKANVNPGILPPQSHPFGHTYNEWAAAWWVWAMEQPMDNSAVVDISGSLAGNNQEGKVWFLAGTYSSGPVVRTATIPLGKALFFPILNYSWLQWPTDPPISDDCIKHNYECLRAPLRLVIDGAVMSAELDGKPLLSLTKYRFESTIFYVTLPDNNIQGTSAGFYGPGVDDGYYLMLAPLSAGYHQLHFQGTLTSGFHLEVTYHLVVQ